MIIYKVTNQKNGKTYIGQTRQSLEDRIAGHCRAAEEGEDRGISHFHDAIRCYGFSSFVVEQLCECVSVEELNQKEKEFIAFFETTDREKGYNLTAGGGGGNTWHYCTEDRKLERRRKLSESQLRRFEDPEQREKQREYAKRAIEARKTLIAQGWKQPAPSLEARKRMGAASRKRNLEKGILPPSRKGSIHSEVSKRRMSQAAQRPWSEKYSEEVAEQKRASASARWEGEKNPNKVTLPSSTKKELLTLLCEGKQDLQTLKEKFGFSLFILREWFKSLGIDNYRRFKESHNTEAWISYFMEVAENENRTNGR